MFLVCFSYVSRSPCALTRLKIGLNLVYSSFMVLAKPDGRIKSYRNICNGKISENNSIISEGINNRRKNNRKDCLPVDLLSSFVYSPTSSNLRLSKIKSVASWRPFSSILYKGIILPACTITISSPASIA